MSTPRFADPSKKDVDYCLNLLDVRVWRETCQLITRGNGECTSIGPKWDLPIAIPNDEQSLKGAGSDALRLTAWQYENEHPGTDIPEVLSQKKDFDVAITQHQ